MTARYLVAFKKHFDQAWIEQRGENAVDTQKLYPYRCEIEKQQLNEEMMQREPRKKGKGKGKRDEEPRKGKGRRKGKGQSGENKWASSKGQQNEQGEQEDKEQIKSPLLNCHPSPQPQQLV